jgi:molybdopterin synthase sulfur carrier subunit
MPVTVRVPTQLRSLTGGTAEVAATGSDVAEVIASLDSSHPGMAERLLDEQGNIRRFVNIFLGEEDVRFLDGLKTSVSEGEVLSIVPAVAGG